MEAHGRQWKPMEDHGTTWKTMEDHEKPWKTMKRFFQGVDGHKQVMDTTESATFIELMLP